MSAARGSRLSRVRALVKSSPAVAVVAGIVLGPPPGLDPPRALPEPDDSG